MDTENASALAGSVESASYNMVLNVSFKFINFFLNSYALRYVDKAVLLGIIPNKLMLLYAIIHIPSLAFRKGCKGSIGEHSWSQRKVNFIWLSLPITALFSSLFCYVWLSLLEQPSEKYLEDYQLAVGLFGLGCIIDSLLEPVYIFAQYFLYVKWIMFMRFVTSLMRTVILFASVLYYSQHVIITIAFGQVAVSILTVSLYWTYFHFEFKRKTKALKNKDLQKDNLVGQLPFSSLDELLPKGLFSTQYEGNSFKATFEFLLEEVLKLPLAQGERILMTTFSVISETEQGIYNAILNLGSLIPRLIFRPIEEDCLNYFAITIGRNKLLKEHDQRKIDQVSAALSCLLRAAILVGCISAISGFFYSHLLLWLYGGDALIEEPGPWLLRTYFLSVFLMAVNGATEAYVSAVRKPSYLNFHTVFMVLFSCIYLSLCLSLCRLFGSAGFIVANCCVMGLRISRSLWFITRQFRDLGRNPLRGIIPRKTEVMALLAGALITCLSEQFIYSQPYHPIILHLAVGASCGMLVLVAILYKEPGLNDYVFSFLKRWNQKFRKLFVKKQN